MQTLAIIVSIANLLGYWALMHVDPTFGLLHPRGGMVMLGISLAIANLGIWAAAQPYRSLNARIQLNAAAWIWLIVQGGCTAYLYSQANTS
ncbi:hypothetical protein [Oxalicibacterium solurbis]|uniref:Uncharacterized protein n=1 Tax=Oxalicibacterium solurbis TaxID=69280 RepID=A0A8J3F502_9BURK|nr:hypothetical protein [Oxalicibacterium solurbis]GGI53554.1 hypothetical protein GCM10011430_07280 [Oxalicibacterium solurbis]